MLLSLGLKPPISQQTGNQFGEWKLKNQFWFLLLSFVLQNVQLECKQSISNGLSGVFYAGSGELFGILKFQGNESRQPDDAASRLLIRNVNSAWIKVADSISQKVYEALVQKVENDCVALKLSPQTCSDLKISEGGQIVVNVQFQLNRKPLCDWHAAIDRLGPLQLRLLFPTPSAPQIKLEVYVFLEIFMSLDRSD